MRAVQTPTHRLLHLTDTHIVPEGELLHGAVDSLANLQRALASVEASGDLPDVVVLTGDLTDTGEPRAYRRLRAVVEESAARMGAQVVYVMGNHDARPAFWAELADRPDADQRSYDVVHDVSGLRVIALDSTVPGHHHGEITDEQLQWLAAELAVPAPEGTVIGLHHAPVPAPSELSGMLGLRNPEALWDVVRGSDVRAVLAGHTHASSATQVDGVLVWTSGAMAYAMDGTAPAGVLRGRFGPVMTRVQVFPDSVAAQHVRLPEGDEPVVYELSLAQMQAAIAAHAG
jgi:3',5'-cyclic AMP phosphodiesterase CpdA